MTGNDKNLLRRNLNFMELCLFISAFVRINSSPDLERNMLNIENLTRTEKLLMMEAIWDDLARDTVPFASPEWHAEKLKDAEVAVAEGRAHFVSWEIAKKKLRDS